MNRFQCIKPFTSHTSCNRCESQILILRFVDANFFFPVMSNLASTIEILEIVFYFSSRMELSVAQETVTSQNDANTE